jgi:hypothetical protein
MTMMTGVDISTLCGAEQLCAGVSSGVEAAVHAARERFDSHIALNAAARRARVAAGLPVDIEPFGMLLIDAFNAFNLLHRPTALLNARIAWPRAAQFIFNLYKEASILVVRGASGHPPRLLWSSSGVVQGCPLSMHLYALSVLPLARLTATPEVTPLWYADDSAALGPLSGVTSWFDKVVEHGPSLGYTPNLEKCVLIVAPGQEDAARAHLAAKGLDRIAVVTGHRYLGGFVGDAAGRSAFVAEKVAAWVKRVEALQAYCIYAPHEVYTVLTKSLMAEWAYIQRVIPDCAEEFAPLDAAIDTVAVPSLFGCSHNDDGAAPGARGVPRVATVPQAVVDLCSLPASRGGLSIRRPSATAPEAFTSSRAGAATLVAALLAEQNDFDSGAHLRCQRAARSEHARRVTEADALRWDAGGRVGIKHRLSLLCLRAVERRRICGSATFLSFIPVLTRRLNLNREEWWDTLASWFDLEPWEIRKVCDGALRKCTALGAANNLRHGLSCTAGGHVIRRHNETRDVLGSVCEPLYPAVVREPKLEANGRYVINEEGQPPQETPLGGLRGDLQIRGLRGAQTQTIIDICVTDVDAVSNLRRGPSSATFTYYEGVKRQKYAAACAACLRADIQPFVVGADGSYGPAAISLMKTLAHSLSIKWGQPYSQSLSWLRARITLAILRASSMCIRASRQRPYKSGLDEGPPLECFMLNDCSF